MFKKLPFDVRRKSIILAMLDFCPSDIFAAYAYNAGTKSQWSKSLVVADVGNICQHHKCVGLNLLAWINLYVSLECWALHVHLR